MITTVIIEGNILNRLNQCPSLTKRLQVRASVGHHEIKRTMFRSKIHYAPTSMSLN